MKTGFRAGVGAFVLALALASGQVAAENIFNAVRSNDPSALPALVERGADVNARNDAGQTALMQAAMQRDGDKLVELLVVLGADIRARDNSGMTALMHAAARGQQENAERLLQIGSDPDVRDNSGKTVIEHARAGGLDAELDPNRIGKPSFVSMLTGKNHKGPDVPPHALFIPHKAGTISAREFEQAVVRTLLRKGWGIAKADGNGARAFYARVKARQLYKAEVIQEPARIVIRFLPGFGFHGEQTYLEGIRASLMQELAMY